MNPANPLDGFGRAVGDAFDRFVTPGLLGMALAIVSIGLIR